MTWQLHPARENFPAFAADWDRLNAALYGRHPFFDSRFIGPLLEHFGDGRELLCLHRTTDGIDGALILHPLGLGRWALFAPSQTQAGAVLLKSARPLETLLPALPGHAWSLDLLAIDPAYAPDWSGLALPRIVHPHALTMAVATDGDFATYWQSRPKKLRDNLRRYQRRAEETAGPLAVTSITDPADIAAALARYGQLESAGWKGQQGTAIAAVNAQGHFYADTLARFAASGQALVMELHADERLVASRLFIRHERMWIALKTTYDESQSAYAPGRLLLHAVLERACADMPGGSVEFYTNASRDQAEWATALRPIPHHQILRNDLAAGLLSILKHLRRRPADQATDTFNPLEVRSYPDIAALPPDARALFDQAETAYPEFAAGWFANLQRTVFTDDPGVRYYVAERTGRPVAILPVRLARYGIVRRVEALGNYYTSLYSPILCPKATEHDLAALLKAASRDHGGAHEMRFAPMDPAAPAYAATLAALRSIDWKPFSYLCFGNWFLDVDSDWPTYLAQRSGELRSTLKRKGKKFAAAGGTLEIIYDLAQAEAAITDFNHVYARSWKKPEPYPEFIPGLIRWLAEQGWLRLGIARMNGQAIAAQLWMTTHGRANIFKLAYDEAFAEYGAGTLLTAKLMECAIDADHNATVDYLIGEDTYKQLWMTQRRQRWGIVAYNPRTLIGLANLFQETVGRTFRSLSASAPSQTSQDAMNWTIVPINRFQDHAAQWDKLVQKSMPAPFLESLFLEPALREFGTGREMLAFFATGNQWHAAAIVSPKRLGVWEVFQPSQLPLGAWVADSQFTQADLGRSLMRSLPGFCIAFSITQQDPLFQGRPQDAPTLSTMDYIDTAWVDIDQPFDSYWNARGKNLRSNLRKQHNKLQADATLAILECIDHPDQITAAIEDYGRLESTGWKGKDGTAVHSDNAQGRFYRTMLENFCKAKRGRIYRYSFNGTTVAMDLCIEKGNTIVILKTAYDETFKAVSPGTLMRYEEFKQIFDEGRLKRIEFYGKVMVWHTRWTETKRSLYHSTFFRWHWITKLRKQKITSAEDTPVVN